MVSRQELSEILCQIADQEEDYFKNKKMRIDADKRSIFITKTNGLAETIEYTSSKEKYYFVGYELFYNYITCQYRIHEVELGEKEHINSCKKEKIIRVEDIEYMIPYDKITFMSIFKDGFSDEKIDLMNGKDLN